MLELVSMFVTGHCGSFNRDAPDFVRFLAHKSFILVTTGEGVLQNIIGKSFGELWCDCLAFSRIGRMA